MEKRLFSVYVSNSLLNFIAKYTKYTYFAEFIISVLFVVIIKLSNLFKAGLQNQNEDVLEYIYDQRPTSYHAVDKSTKEVSL